MPSRRTNALRATLALLSAGACREAEQGPPTFDDLFELERTLEIVPVEVFAQPPASIVELPDGRFALPETEGTSVHVVDREGRGLARIGGPAPGVLGSGEETLGRFQSISDVAPLPGGGLVVSDRTSNVLTLFDAELRPEETRILPETRSVWQLEALADGAIAAAVSPRHPVAGGQIIIVHADGRVTAHLQPDAVLRYNRWESVSSTRMEALADGTILAYWPPMPWARAVAASGDTLGRFGGPSKRYKPPGTGPPPRAPLEEIRAWLRRFTPLLAVESPGPYVVFEFQEATASGREAATRAPTDTTSQGVAGGEAGTFANIYDASGRRLLADLPLPRGARILKSNDPERLYLLREAAPRSLVVEIRRPDAARARELASAAARTPGVNPLPHAARGRSVAAPAGGRSPAAR